MGCAASTQGIHVAAEKCDIDAVVKYADSGADVNFPDKSGETPLHKAAANMLNLAGEPVAIIEFLLERGANIEAQAKGPTAGWTPLHYATSRSQTEIAACLIAQNANVVAITDDGVTPLHMAASLGNIELVEMLLLHGADVASREVNGFTPFDYACDSTSILPPTAIHVMQCLIQHGGDVNGLDNEGRSPLDRVKHSPEKEDIAMALRQFGALEDSGGNAAMDM